MRARIAFIFFQYSSISSAPPFERLTVVLIFFLSMISLVRITSPACFRLVNCTDRFPLLLVQSRFAEKQSQLRNMRRGRFRIASRAGSCTRRLGMEIVLFSSFNGIVVIFLSPLWQQMCPT